MTQLKIFLCLTQAPNTAMQICRNKGATKMASRKTVYDNVFSKKGHFYPKNCSTAKTKYKSSICTLVSMF